MLSPPRWVIVTFTPAQFPLESFRGISCPSSSRRMPACGVGIDVTQMMIAANGETVIARIRIVPTTSDTPRVPLRTSRRGGVMGAAVHTEGKQPAYAAGGYIPV